jgi:hypothetical protein
MSRKRIFALAGIILGSFLLMAFGRNLLDLTSQVKNVLGPANGGTGLTSISSFCVPGGFQPLTDGTTVDWPVNGQMCGNASLLLTAHGGSRTLIVSGLVDGGSYVLTIQQDGTGGEGIALGTGCTWKVSNGGAGTIAPSTGPNAIDVMAWTYKANGSTCLVDFATNFN